MNNRKFLIFLLVSFLILSVVTIIPTVNNLKELDIIPQKSIDNSLFNEQSEEITVDDARKIKRLEDDINDYATRSTNTDNAESKKIALTDVITGICDALCYYGQEYDDIDLYAETKEEIIKYVTEECFENDITENFYLGDTGGNSSYVKLDKIMFADLDTDTPKALVLTEYRTRLVYGTQYMDCEFVYDSKTKQYYASDIEVVRNITKKKGLL